MELEKIINTYKKAVELKDRAGEKFSKNAAYRYGVDFLSGALYYTTTYGLQELLAGKEWETMVETRKIGLGVHALLMRYIGVRRNNYAEKYNVTKESPFWDKVKVNALAIVPVQTVAYSAMLVGGMAQTNKWDSDAWESSAISLALGLGLSAFHAFPYGVVADKFRNFFGMKPAIDKKDVVAAIN